VIIISIKQQKRELCFYAGVLCASGNLRVIKNIKKAKDDKDCWGKNIKENI
jgi:hypothetical protein